jgi:LCP family protein required for cell wall assembly
MNYSFPPASLSNSNSLHRRLIWIGIIGVALGVAACGAANAASAPTTIPTAPSRPPTETPRPAEPAISPPPTETSPPADTPTPTPTGLLVGEPTLGYFNITPAANATLVTPFPTPVTPLELDEDLVNILLIGTDYRASEKAFRTDTLIVVSINKQTGDVTMLSIPRDLYVYVPTWGMQRINKAYADGEASSYAGGGPGLLKQTLLYNLGIPIHYHALVNFDGFRQIVDAVGGIDVAVNCQLTEYKIKDWSLDESDPASYELYTQPIGVTHMDGALALWYARARPVGGDFFRSYRQRQVLRAIYHEALDANMIPQIPDLYAHVGEVVETDMGLWDVMPLTPLAAKLKDSQLRSLHIGPNQTTFWVTPGGDDVLLPDPGPLQALVNEAFTPPSGNQLARPVTVVEIWNTTANADLAQLAAETLANEGFAPVIGAPDTSTVYEQTTLVDFTTSPKGSPLKKLQSYLHVADSNVVAQPDANSAAQFRVILGNDYNACPRLDWMDAPDATATPTP